MTKDTNKFHPLKLSLNIDNKLLNQIKNFEVQSKSNNNFLWMVYKDGSKVGIELDKIDDNYMKNNFNENYFGDPDDNKEGEKDETKSDYSFIDLSGKNNKQDIPELDYEIYGNFVEKTDGDWEVISVDSEDL